MVDALFILATWRLTSLFVREDGPWDIFGRLRHLIGVRYDEASQPTGTNVAAKAILCVWCFSLWVALPMAFLKVFYFSNISNVGAALTWLAYSAGAILLDEVIMKA